MWKLTTAHTAIPGECSWGTAGVCLREPPLAQPHCRVQALAGTGPARQIHVTLAATFHLQTTLTELWGLVRADPRFLLK